MREKVLREDVPGRAPAQIGVPFISTRAAPLRTAFPDSLSLDPRAACVSAALFCRGRPAHTHPLFSRRMRPSLLAAAASLLGDALLPTKVAGVWRKPALSGRKAAEAAKALLKTDGGSGAAVPPPPSTR